MMSLAKGYPLDQQQGAIGAEDAERAFGLASPIGRQQGRYRFDEAQVFVRRCRK
ncbi:MAG: hypothetical protein ACM3JG_19355 [Thiohalocapsa sp.]